MSVLLSVAGFKRYSCVMRVAELMSPLHRGGKEWGL